jgi:alpha-glucosidase (family GH31 glycosyl hydrolase)
VLSAENLRSAGGWRAHTERKILGLPGRPRRWRAVVRSLEYAYPHSGYADLDDQFLLGPDVLVAPVVEKGARKRRLVVPPGRWQGEDASLVQGPTVVEIGAPLDRLPWYRRIGA